MVGITGRVYRQSDYTSLRIAESVERVSGVQGANTRHGCFPKL